MCKKVYIRLLSIKNYTYGIEQRRFIRCPDSEGIKMRETISLPIDGKVIVIRVLEKNDSLLFLYGKDVKKHYLFRSFIDVGLKNNELCLYAFYPEKRLRLDDVLNEYVAKGILHLFPIGKDVTKLPEMNEQDRTFRAISELHSRIYKMYNNAKSEGRPLRVLIDFDKMANPDNIETIINCEKIITQKIERLSLQEKRKGGAKDEVALNILSGFDVNSLDTESTSRIIKLHKKIVISAHGESTLLLPYFSSGRFDREPTLDIEVISRKNVEEVIKNSLDVITLSLLQQEPMCGFEIIRRIAQKYNVILSQGTVYPLLYSLKDNGILKIHEGGRREKTYTLTEKGKKTIETKLNDFAKTHEYLLDLIVPSSTLNK